MYLNFFSVRHVAYGHECETRGKHLTWQHTPFSQTQERHSDHCVPCKVSCRNCGSHLLCVLDDQRVPRPTLTVLTKMRFSLFLHSDEGKNMVMAYPPSFGFKNQQIPDAFAPSCHIFYGERVMNVDDGVPKVC